MSTDIRRTMHADQAVHLADLVSLKFSGARFGTTRRRILKVTEPDGPSTDGGRKARQSIVLELEHPDNNATVIVCGWLDVFRRVAELKAYPVVAQSHQERYHAPIDISKSEYQRMLDLMFEFLRGLEIDARMAHAARARSSISENRASSLPAASSPALHRPGLTERIALVVGGTLFGFALCYALVALRFL